MRSQKYYLPVLLLLIISILLVGCASKQPATPTTAPTAVATETNAPMMLVDGLGRTVQLDQVAQRIISIGPSNTEILYAIGAGSQVVGRDEFSDYPEEAKQVKSIGGGYGSLDMETIVALKPDLVLASQLIPAEQVQSMEKLGLKVYLLANPVEIEGLFDNLKLVGKITGKDAQAQSLVDQLAVRVAAVDEKIIQAESRPSVFYQVDSTDPSAPWTAGVGSFIDALITRAGGTNLGAKMDVAYGQMSLENLLVENPQVIIVGDFTWGGVTAEDVLARDTWSNMDAIKQGKVYIFDDNLVSRPGPRLIDGLESMAKLLHPELFQ